MSEMTAYEIVMKSREKGRPTALKYIEKTTENFFELHGDRKFGDDKSIVGGIAEINGKPVTVIGIEKGETTNEKVLRNFGQPRPEGYRKALRLMKQAEKFRRPVLCFVDTPGAYPGIDAEERGQAEAIAVSIRDMMGLKTPVLSVVIGEGGSGGALGIAVADEVWITETATYSVISPEACASILWKNKDKAKEAAQHLKLTADNLKELGAVDRVIAEENFGDEFFEKLKTDIAAFFEEKEKLDADTLTKQRYERFRDIK